MRRILLTLCCALIVITAGHAQLANAQEIFPTLTPAQTIQFRYYTDPTFRHAFDELTWQLEADASERGCNGCHQRIANCEVGGNWAMRGTHYSGNGFLNASWTQWRLDGMPANAGAASIAEQIVVMDRIRNELRPYGSFRGGKWGCAPTVGAP